MRATRAIPIVVASSGDPVATGIVASLARPGGNVMGLSALASDVQGKQLEILREMVPALARVAFLFNMSNPVVQAQWREAGRAPEPWVSSLTSWTCGRPATWIPHSMPRADNGPMRSSSASTR